MNNLSFFKALLMKELNEKDLPGDQEKIAQAAEPKDKITGADFKALRAKKEGFSEDHEVSMAHNSLESIIKSAMELKAKLGDDEKDIPAWIQDHITNAENYINQASKNYHEYSNGEHDMDELPDGTVEVPVDDKPEFISERREYDQEAMEKLGFNLYPGGRTEAWEFATEELGVSPAEILGKMSDDDVYNAISDSLEILGYYNDEDDDLSETSLQKIMEDLLEAKKKPSAGLSKKQKSAIVKKAKSGKDIGKKGKGFEKVMKAAEKGGADNPRAVAAAAMWKSAAKKAK